MVFVTSEQYSNAVVGLYYSFFTSKNAFVIGGKNNVIGGKNQNFDKCLVKITEKLDFIHREKLIQRVLMLLLVLIDTPPNAVMIWSIVISSKQSIHCRDRINREYPQKNKISAKIAERP